MSLVLRVRMFSCQREGSRTSPRIHPPSPRDGDNKLFLFKSFCLEHVKTQTNCPLVLETERIIPLLQYWNLSVSGYRSRLNESPGTIEEQLDSSCPIAFLSRYVLRVHPIRRCLDYSCGRTVPCCPVYVLHDVNCPIWPCQCFSSPVEPCSHIIITPDSI